MCDFFKKKIVFKTASGFSFAKQWTKDFKETVLRSKFLKGEKDPRFFTQIYHGHFTTLQKLLSNLFIGYSFLEIAENQLYNVIWASVWVSPDTDTDV